jgi:hypothetical protein
MIHKALSVALVLCLAPIGASILFAVFLFVRSQKQKWDRDRGLRDYCARADADEAARRAEGRWRRAYEVGEDLLNDALEKIGAGYRHKTKDHHGCSWIH